MFPKIDLLALDRREISLTMINNIAVQIIILI